MPRRKVRTLAKADKQRFKNEMAAYKEQLKSMSDDTDSVDDEAGEESARDTMIRTMMV